MRDTAPVAKRTTFTGNKPGRASAPRRRLLAVLAFDGIVLADLATACLVFGFARQRGGEPAYDIRVCGPGPSAACGDADLSVRWTLALLRQADTIMIPGIAELDCPVPEKVLVELRRAVNRGACVASICTGAFVLAQTGALDGHVATTHWQAAPELARRFPAITVNPDVLYVDRGLVLTSAGVAAGFDLCLHMVRRDCGAKVAAHVARMVVMPLERDGGQAQFIVPEEPDLPDATFAPLLNWIGRNLRNDLSLRVLARRASMSGRSLSRRFRLHVGMTPAKWIARVRLREAQRLLETTSLSVEAVAEAAGYGSATVLREKFAAFLGVSPRAYRRSFSAPITGVAARRAR